MFALCYPVTRTQLKAGRLLNSAFQLASHATLEVYNVLGQKVVVLADGRFEAGHHTVNWNGSDKDGHKLASGVYLYQLRTMGKTLTRRLTIIR